MLVVTVDFVNDHDLILLGMVEGSTIQSKNIGKDIASGLKTLVGGELKAYSKMLEEAREIAINRMIAEAEKLQADAIINVRFASSSVMAGASEMLAYGTAVKYKVQNDLQQF